MADLIIHGMEMPETCYECPCGDNEFYECMATKERFGYHRDEYGYPDGERQDWCPLKVKQPLTQADRIRAMSDEELASLLVHSPWFREESALDWLKQEVDSDPT